MERSAWSTDWRRRAACRNLRQEMVPDDSFGEHLAKKLCADCPVVASCYAESEQITQRYGPAYAEGIWGGLTVRERGTMIGLQIPPAPCPQCGLICVPVGYATDRCQACDPGTTLTYADYRPQIEQLIADELTYEQVADRLRLDKGALVSACGRWKIRSRTRSTRTRGAVKQCGTLAAKERHRKRHESWENCACKQVAWKRGNTRKSDQQAGKCAPKRDSVT